MAYHKLDSLSCFERKEYQELKFANSEEARKQKERIVILGLFVISLLATLMISGALDLSTFG